MKSLERFGTIAFDRQVIRLNIGYYALVDVDGQVRKVASPGSLNLFPWLDMVPPTYREEARQCAQTIAERFYKKKATPATLAAFADQLSALIFASVAPREPT